MLEAIVAMIAELAFWIVVVDVQPGEGLELAVGTERDGVYRVASSMNALEKTKEH